MKPSRFTKQYGSPERCQTAVRHYAWLAQHATPVRLPALRAIGPTSLVFDFIDGRHAQPADLPLLAAHLGDVHGSAWANDLHRARLSVPHVPGEGLVLADYPASRLQALGARHRAGFLATDAALSAARDLLARTVSGPAAFYKDANPRNFLITDDAVFTIDIDDLTLAPFGYDLAKLIVTLAMTYGDLSPVAVREALDRYNQAAAAYDDSLGRTDSGRLDAFMELHRILTAPYLGRGGYRHDLLRAAGQFGTDPKVNTA
jgi:hypothetical protein